MWSRKEEETRGVLQACGNHIPPDFLGIIAHLAKLSSKIVANNPPCVTPGHPLTLPPIHITETTSPVRSFQNIRWYAPIALAPSKTSAVRCFSLLDASYELYASQDFQSGDAESCCTIGILEARDWISLIRRRSSGEPGSGIAGGDIITVTNLPASMPMIKPVVAHIKGRKEMFLFLRGGGCCCWPSCPDSCAPERGSVGRVCCCGVFRWIGRPEVA